MNAYEYKQERRRERLERAAARATTEGQAKVDAGFGFFHDMNGQPVLVGHHSEKRHRNAIRKADDRIRSGFARLKEAGELAHRAAAVGTGGISSDDPEAVDKLEHKVETLERRRDQMKAANAHWRKHKSMKGFPGISDEEAARLDVKISTDYAWCRQPYPAYTLTNLGARIREAKRRASVIEHRTHQLETAQAAGAPTATDTAYPGGATVTEDLEENRVLLRFPARLSKPDYQQVRSRGFVWSPTRSAFVRKLGSNSLWLAQDLATRLPSVALVLALLLGAGCAPRPAGPEAERTFLAALNTYCSGSDYREPICAVPLSQDFGR